MTLAPTRTLVIVNLLTLAGLAYLWADPHGQLKNSTWTAPAPVKPVISAALPAASQSEPSTLVATLERPLFAPDRRPPPPAPPDLPPPPPDPLSDVHLLGLISGESGSALLRSEGAVRRVSLRQKLGEWTLQSIDDRTATFTRVDETRVIRLEYKNLGIQAIASTSPTAGVLSKAASQQTDVTRRQAEEATERDRQVDDIRARMSRKAHK